ncbi:MAG TPA: ATP-binding cassette domain-containing protein [Candidatus Latescibacteria bacterium]|jgi:phosphonate transport system ATP-binding protein|nr:ATP-binding cassette domain-containing protein [Candidatus Latescibacterota bacterium]HJP33692.1 ATP-binding cassette domain-containing protein [Candidatus Latescibacterota bacterium]
MYDLNGISVSYAGVAVLQDINLAIDEGEKVVIIGPSGAGKTTLLRKLYELQQDRATLVHQDYALVPQLSAFHNIYSGRLDERSSWYNLVNLIRPRPADVADIEPIFRDLGMADKLFARVSTLSGGQQQRIAVGRAVYRGSDVILADEPVSAIDPHQAGAVLDLIKSRMGTVILAMHDVQLALEHFPRVIGLRDGGVFFDKPSAQVGDEDLAELYRREKETSVDS